VLAQLAVSEDDLARWHEKGWVSFGPQPDFEVDIFDGPHLRELSFVRDISRSGLSDAQLGQLFSLLPKPFTFDPTRITFSFMYGWVQTKPAPRYEIENEIDSWLEDLAQSGDRERLQEIECRIKELLEELGSNDDGDANP
jgi:hypothetical protein